MDAKLIAKVLAGLGAGGAFGYYAMPHVSGYGDVESARRLSGTMNATTGAILGALAHNPTAAKAMWKGLSGAQKAKLTEFAELSDDRLYPRLRTFLKKAKKFMS